MEELESGTEDEYLFVDIQRDSYKPGDQVEGSVHWKFAESAGQIEVRLLMEVAGKETVTSCATGLQWNHLPEEGICKFSLIPPEGPYSFHGKGFQIRWYVEAKCPELDWIDDAEFTYSPTGAPLRLTKEV